MKPDIYSGIKVECVIVVIEILNKFIDNSSMNIPTMISGLHIVYILRMD